MLLAEFCRLCVPQKNERKGSDLKSSPYGSPVFSLQPYPGVPLLGHPAVGGGRDRVIYIIRLELGSLNRAI